MTDQEKGHKAPESRKNAFQSVAVYVRENKLQTSALLTSLLLGSTSLATPLLTSSLGAAAVLGGSIWLLLQNGNTTIQNTLALGSKHGLSTMTLGLIIGSLNTIPEVMVSLGSAFRGAIELGVGNIVGSNIAHTLLILGATAAIAGIAKAKDMSWKFNTLVMAGTTALFGSQMITGTLSPVIGGAMLLGGVGYLVSHIHTIQKEEKHHSHGHDNHSDHDHSHDEDCEIGECLFHDHSHGHDEDDRKAKERPKWLNAVLAGSGMLGLIAAADLIVQSGISVANQFNFSAIGLEFGLSEAAVGAVIVAIGTALPELSINIEAIKKKHSDLAIGNVLGCSIINTLIAGGVISLTGAPVPDAFNPSTAMGLVNTGVFMGSAGLLTATLLMTKGAMSRWMGAVALATYTGYIGSSLALNDGDINIHDHGAHTPQKIEIIEHHGKLSAPAPL